MRQNFPAGTDGDTAGSVGTDDYGRFGQIDSGRSGQHWGGSPTLASDILLREEQNLFSNFEAPPYPIQKLTGTAGASFFSISSSLSDSVVAISTGHGLISC